MVPDHCLPSDFQVGVPALSRSPVDLSTVSGPVGPPRLGRPVVLVHLLVIRLSIYTPTLRPSSCTDPDLPGLLILRSLEDGFGTLFPRTNTKFPPSFFFRVLDSQRVSTDRCPTVSAKVASGQRYVLGSGFRDPGVVGVSVPRVPSKNCFLTVGGGGEPGTTTKLERPLDPVLLPTTPVSAVEDRTLRETISTPGSLTSELTPTY